MKSILSLNLDIDVVEGLKAHAKASGKSASEMANTWLRGLIGIAPEASTERLTRKEQFALDAYKRLVEKHKAPDHPQAGNEFFTKQQIVNESGLYKSEALQALRGLETKKVLKQFMFQDITMLGSSPEIPHWGKCPPQRK